MTPLEYIKKDHKILLFSSRGSKSDWFRNLKANPQDVIIKRHFRKFRPDVRIVDTVEERLELIKWYAKYRPRGAMILFGWDPDIEYDPKDYEAIAEYLRIVELSK